jgi:hypothetical protein
MIKQRIERRIDTLGEDEDELPYVEEEAYHNSNGIGDTVNASECSSRYVVLRMAPEPLGCTVDTMLTRDEDGLTEHIILYVPNIITINPDAVERVDYEDNGVILGTEMTTELEEILSSED